MEKKLLLIEDDPVIREALAELLKIEGYRVDAVSNGQEALRFLKAASVLPNLIILDLMMPIMDGFQFRNEQRQNETIAGIPVVIMSADGNVTQKQERIGSLGYLKKPIDIDLALRTIDSLFERTFG